MPKRRFPHRCHPRWLTDRVEAESAVARGEVAILKIPKPKTSETAYWLVAKKPSRVLPQEEGFVLGPSEAFKAIQESELRLGRCSTDDATFHLRYAEGTRKLPSDDPFLKEFSDPIDSGTPTGVPDPIEHRHPPDLLEDPR